MPELDHMRDDGTRFAAVVEAPGLGTVLQLGVLHSPILDAVSGWLIVIQGPDGNRIRLYTLESHGPEVKPATDSPWLAG
jgi:hypothetical protein